ncbi:multidrug ABC transporter ATP-binding protein, partial [Achromobacter xylosoxidans]
KLTLPWLASHAINALQQNDMPTAGLWILFLVGSYMMSWAGPGRPRNERCPGSGLGHRVQRHAARACARGTSWRKRDGPR